MLCRAFIFSLSLVLTGCGTSLLPLYEAPTIPEDDVKVLRAHFARFAENGEFRSFVYEGITISNQRCDKFFDDLDAYRTRSDFAIRELAALSTALPPALRAAEVSGQAIANVASALGFASGWIKDSKELFLLTEFKPAIYAKWQRARDIQRGRIDDWLANSSAPHTLGEAKYQVYEYTRMCLPSQLKQWLHESANSGEAGPPGERFVYERYSNGSRQRSKGAGPIVFH